MTRINTTRFGEVEVDEKQIYCFEQGLPGFPDEQSFALLPYEPESPFFFLQSVQNKDLAFLVVEPFSFFKDYQFELSNDLVQQLELSDDKLPLVFNVVTVPENPQEMTANLLAPIILSPHLQKGLQWVMEKSAFQVKHRLFPNGFAESQASKEAK